jgi:hypothetical protein
MKSEGVSDSSASIEKKPSTALLSIVQRHRQAPSIAEGDLRVSRSVPASIPRLREAQFSDFKAVTELKRRWLLTPYSFENWERLWHHNPALGQMQSKCPIGWVLEADGAVVGYLGNIPVIYRYGDRTLTAVTGHGLVVDPLYRAVGLSLVAAFYRQKSADLYLTTTAIDAVGKIALGFKSAPLPQPDYDTVLLWVLQPYPFAQAKLKKLNLSPALSQIGSIFVSLAVATDKILRRRWPRRSSMPYAISEITLSEIGDDFQALWIKKLNEGPRLLADRSPAALRWHFDIPGDKGTTRVLCCHQNGELLGYAVIRHEAPHELYGLRRSSIADTLVAQDDPTVVEALWFAAYDRAKSAGSHVLEVLGFPQRIRRACFQWNPYQRKYPACTFYYKAADPMLHKALSDDMAW